MVTADQAEALGAADRRRILCTPVDLRGLDWVATDRQPFVVAVPNGHPLATKPALALKNLDGQALVMYVPVESRSRHDLVSRCSAWPRSAETRSSAWRWSRTSRAPSKPAVSSELTLVWRTALCGFALRAEADAFS